MSAHISAEVIDYTCDMIQTNLDRLAVASHSPNHAEWTSHVPVLESGHIAVGYRHNVVADRNVYTADFVADSDEEQLRIQLGNLSHIQTGESLQPGAMRGGWRRNGNRRFELVRPGIVEGFVVKAMRHSGLVTVHGLVEGGEQPLSKMSHNREVSYKFLTACHYALSAVKVQPVSAHPNAASPEPIPVSA